MAEPSILDDFQAEQEDLHSLLAELDQNQWLVPTPAEGWDVRDSVAHLAFFEDVCRDTLTGGPLSLNTASAQYDEGEDFINVGRDKGRGMAPPEVLEWWVTSAASNRAAFAAADQKARYPWGLGMGWRSLVTARLMEHWAHGLDIRAAIEEPGIDTARLRHVAWIGYSALPYAFGVAHVEPPAGHTLRLELAPPEAVGGDPWVIGPDDATDRITGLAGQWCRIAVQRMNLAEARDLEPDGPLAGLALAHARAFL
jgi:uncharacterized protein (TIGR03084 family)